MSPQEQSCPFCNAVVAIPATVKAGEMFPCPRCEERFKVLAGPASGITSELPALTRPGSPLPALTQPGAPGGGRRRLSNRTLGLIVVGVMLFMAAGATVLALATKDSRRANDSGIRQSRVRKPAVGLLGLAAMMGLGATALLVFR